MKILKRIAVLTVLASLLGGLAPSSGICQMSDVKVLTCNIPCCKTTDKPPTCPMVKPAPPQDVIGISVLSVSPSLQVLAVISHAEVLAPARRTVDVQRQPQIPRQALCSTPQSIPAPPTLA
jgi:hypothetical protein